MVLVLDGGLGTELEHRGCVINQDKLWSARLLLDDPERLVQVHQSYFEAGADIVTSATYQFSFESFQETKGLSREECEALLKKSLEIADKARRAITDGRPRYIAASFGSYGAVLADGSEFTGEFGMSEEDLVDFHFQRMRCVLINNSIVPEFVAIETIPCLIEVRAVCQALAKVMSELGKEIPAKVWVSLSCRGPDLLNSGEPLQEALKLLNHSGLVNMIGFNCTDPRHLDLLFQHAIHEIQKPLVVYPNRGESFVDRAWVPSSGTSDDEFVDMVSGWVKKYGAEKIAIVGGCCKSSSLFVR